MRIALTALGLVLAAPAFAGGYVEPAAPAPAPVVPIPVAAPTWDGWYGGVQIEYGDGSVTTGDTLEGNLYGIFGGYRADLGNIVIGGEWDYVHGGLESAANPANSADTIFRSGLEVGYDAGALLPYATVGAAYIHLDVPGPVPPGFDRTGFGYFYGLGVDYAVTDNVTIGAELLQHEFEDLPIAGTDIDALTFGLNASFRF